jgi:hypothetical protein
MAKQALARKGTVSKRGKAHTKKSAPLPERQPSTPGRRRELRKQRTASPERQRPRSWESNGVQGKRQKVSPRRTEPSRQAAEATEETVIVDIIEEPVPGVVVVTEFEWVQTSGPEAPGPQPESGESPDLAQREGDKAKRILDRGPNRTRSRPEAILGWLEDMSSARASAVFPTDARRKFCGKLIQQVPSGRPTRSAFEVSCTNSATPDIEIRERVIVDHQGRGKDREVNRPL